MKKLFRSLIAAPLLALAAGAGHAVSLGTSDQQGDFLSTYTGPHAGDVDVLFAYSIYDQTAGTFTFGATMNAPIGTTADARYIWGIDRGAGTARLASGTPSVGTGVKFDAVISLTGAGTGSINLFTSSPTNLAASAISIINNSITVTVAASALPSTGFALTSYKWNVWPRVGTGSNTQISDFAPNNTSLSVLAVSPVPEPDALAMMLAGLGLVGFVARRRSKAA